MPRAGRAAARPTVWLIADGPDPDNYAAAIAATSNDLGLRLGGVIMTGRPANDDHDASPYAADPETSARVRRDNALRMKDLLVKFGRGDVPVYEGGYAPYSTIPHRIHIDERIYDTEPHQPGTELAGGIEQAAEAIAQERGPVHIIAAGPLTDVATLMEHEGARAKLGVLTGQLGMYGDRLPGADREGSGERVTTMSGGNRQFNVLADSAAMDTVMADYPGPVYMVSTDSTKSPEFAFKTPDEMSELVASPAFEHLVDKMYRPAWPEMWTPRGEDAYVHDFHPVEMMSDLLHEQKLPHQSASMEPQRVGRYEYSRVSVDHVPNPGPNGDRSEESRWGEVDLAPTPDPDGPMRLLVTDMNRDPQLHRQTLARVLNAPAVGAEASAEPARDRGADRSLGERPRATTVAPDKTGIVKRR